MTKATIRYILLFLIAWFGMTFVAVLTLSLANLVGEYYGPWGQYGSLIGVIGVYSAFLVRGFLQDIGPVIANPDQRIHGTTRGRYPHVVED